MSKRPILLGILRHQFPPATFGESVASEEEARLLQRRVISAFAGPFKYESLI